MRRLYKRSWLLMSLQELLEIACADQSIEVRSIKLLIRIVVCLTESWINNRIGLALREFLLVLKIEQVTQASLMVSMLLNNMHLLIDRSSIEITSILTAAFVAREVSLLRAANHGIATRSFSKSWLLGAWAVVLKASWHGALTATYRSLSFTTADVALRADTEVTRLFTSSLLNTVCDNNLRTLRSTLSFPVVTQINFE